MTTDRVEPLKITDHPDHTEVKIVEPCEIRATKDTTIWQTVNYPDSQFAAGDVWIDTESPEGARRSYRVMVDGTPGPIYWSREHGRAFAELMEPWFPSRRKDESDRQR